MKTDGEIWQDSQDAGQRPPEERLGDTVEPQGAALIDELRRVEGIRIREVQAGSYIPPPGDGRSDDENAPRPERRKGVVNRAIHAGLGRLRSSYRFLVSGNGGSLAADTQEIVLVARLKRAFEDELRTGLRVLVAGMGIVGGWAVLVPLSAAVVVAGTLVAASNVKKVQHPNGGIVAEIFAHDGMLVKEGDLLVRLDETQVRTNLEVVTKQLDEVRVRVARLTAERDGMDAPKLPQELASRLGNKDVEQLFSSEKSLFEARASARQSQKELLRGQIGQLGQQISGLDAQIRSKAAQLRLITGELEGIQSLYDKHLVPLTRLTALQREAARLDGERGQLVSTIAETQAKISGAELQIVRIDQEFRAEVTKDLRESQDKEAELAERSVAAQDQLNRIIIRAPSSGVVHELSAHTIGGVIGPAEVIMVIVPDLDDLQIEARLSPNDIDQVRIGQKAIVRFPAFNQRTTPQLSGTVSYVSADLSHDQQTHAAYYTIKAILSREELERLGDLQLVSGMPAELFLETGSRTMMSYLLKPITDQLRRTFNQR
ncbi:HlyD family secretion protein [Rhizobiales bacterium GAS191]|nr:HlyD family secretion protein [Rhizobiales bacterium GAS191]